MKENRNSTGSSHHAMGIRDMVRWCIEVCMIYNMMRDDDIEIA